MELKLEQDRIAEFLNHFEENKHDETVMRCIYVVGPSGSGKTTFVQTTLKKLGYDAVNYAASDVRNKPNMDINLSRASGTNIIGMFRKCKTKIAIVMDDIECMNNGDKGGINSLIKLVRPKKNKKQKGDPTTLTPVVCIGAPRSDKKMKELMKCCLVIKIPEPSRLEMLKACEMQLPTKQHLHETVATYAGYDYKKLMSVCELLRRADIPVSVFEPMHLLEDAKLLTKNILNKVPKVSEHSSMISEADRTIVSLLWHENVADVLDNLPDRNAVYSDLMDTLCYVDYLDRVTFQKQIWVLNELTSLMKTFSVTAELHEHKNVGMVKDVRFTKVLTKYSTEYNNGVFMHRICEEVGMEKSELFKKLMEMDDMHMTEVGARLNLSVVDVSRAYRYMESIGIK
jgi:hypothetical protein